MSKVNAYKCDYGNHLVEDDIAVGVNHTEDMFDKLLSFPSVHTPVAMGRCAMHYCMDCYRAHVLIPASNMVDPRKNEEGYKAKVKELAYGLRSQTVHNYRVAMRGKKS